jgi:hypothetical protein
LLAVALVVPGSSLYYRATNGEGCAAACHEMRDPYNVWRESTHRSVACTSCHGDPVTSGPAFEMANARRLFRHVRDELPEQIRMKGLDAAAIIDRCRNCHRQEFADWNTGPHGSTFTTIFLDAKHNRATRLRDDCFRCHGSYYEGGIGQLVAPVDTKGPWRMVDAEWTRQPAMPCLACHQMHRRGEPLKSETKPRPHPALGQELQRPSIALFDRRSMMHIAASDLPLPAMLDGARLVRMSPDRRQALCYECHAPLPTRQVASGDDRTGIGVHEGISCLACHEKHGQKTRASCATCHPRLSNCGIDVEKMDTTFASAASRHNIHFVKCVDCHTKGVPPRRASLIAQIP